MTASALRSLAERAFKWSALTTAGRFVLQFVAQVLLARLLGPGNYGVYGIGMVVLTFAAFLSGNAFSYILMLQKDVDADDIRFAFTWQLIAGVVGSAAMYASAGSIASYFADPRIERMVHWLAAACLLMALAGPSTCLLQRDLNFRVLGLIQMASYAAGYLVVGLPLALHGHGAQSLAAACVVQAAVVLVASFAARPHSLRPLLRHPLAGRHAGHRPHGVPHQHRQLAAVQPGPHRDRPRAEHACGRPVRRRLQHRVDPQRAAGQRDAADVPGRRRAHAGRAAGAGRGLAHGAGLRAGPAHAGGRDDVAAGRRPGARAVRQRPGWTPAG